MRPNGRTRPDMSIPRDPDKARAWKRRQKPIGKGDPAKRAARFVERFGGNERREWIASMPCAVCGEYGWTENAHVRRQSQGGKAGDVVPLCGDRRGVTGCHTQFDQYRLEEHRLRLGQLAKRLDAEWNERGGHD